MSFFEVLTTRCPPKQKQKKCGVQRSTQLCQPPWNPYTSKPPAAPIPKCCQPKMLSLMVCGRGLGASNVPSLTRFEQIRELNIPGAKIFDQKGECVLQEDTCFPCYYQACPPKCPKPRKVKCKKKRKPICQPCIPEPPPCKKRPVVINNYYTMEPPCPPVKPDCRRTCDVGMNSGNTYDKTGVSRCQELLGRSPLRRSCGDPYKLPRRNPCKPQRCTLLPSDCCAQTEYPIPFGATPLTGVVRQVQGTQTPSRKQSDCCQTEKEPQNFTCQTDIYDSESRSGFPQVRLPIRPRQIQCPMRLPTCPAPCNVQPIQCPPRPCPPKPKPCHVPPPKCLPTHHPHHHHHDHCHHPCPPADPITQDTPPAELIPPPTPVRSDVIPPPSQPPSQPPTQPPSHKPSIAEVVPPVIEPSIPLITEPEIIPEPVKSEVPLNEPEPITPPEEPIENLPEEPTEDLPEEPIEDPPEEPEENMPEEPVENQPEEPFENPPEDPVEPLEDIPEEPIENRPGKPRVTLPGKPKESIPGKPKESIPGKPKESIPGKPIQDPPDEPIENQPEEPIENPPEPIPGPEKSPVKCVPRRPQICRPICKWQSCTPPEAPIPISCQPKIEFAPAPMRCQPRRKCAPLPICCPPKRECVPAPITCQPKRECAPVPISCPPKREFIICERGFETCAAPRRCNQPRKLNFPRTNARGCTLQEETCPTYFCPINPPKPRRVRCKKKKKRSVVINNYYVMQPPCPPTNLDNQRTYDGGMNSGNMYDKTGIGRCQELLACSPLRRSCRDPYKLPRRNPCKPQQCTFLLSQAEYPIPQIPLGVTPLTGVVRQVHETETQTQNDMAPPPTPIRSNMIPPLSQPRAQSHFQPRAQSHFQPYSQPRTQPPSQPRTQPPSQPRTQPPSQPRTQPSSQPPSQPPSQKPSVAEGVPPVLSAQMSSPGSQVTVVPSNPYSSYH